MSKGSQTFDNLIEKATPDHSKDTDWARILDICDKAGQSSTASKECLHSLMNRLEKAPKTSQAHTLTLLDSCVLNCGNAFLKEVATADFIKEARTFLSKAPTENADKFKEMLKKWAENEFKKDSSLSAIPAFYQNLRKEGAYFGMASPPSSNISKGPTKPIESNNDSKEKTDLELAIELSLKESQQKGASKSLYPTMSGLGSSNSLTYDSYQGAPHSHTSTEKQARALYDFEAAEENELTFKTGEMITVLDDSDVNWWKGKTWRGEGLFPANFVTTDLEAADANEQGNKRTVQFNEEVEVEQFDPENAKIDESVIDSALDMIQNADPTGLTDDSQEMINLEEECKAMVPLIDGELEQIDGKHNELMLLNQKLVDSFQMYTQLMTESASTPQYTSSPSKYMTTNSSMSQHTQQYQPGQHSYQSMPSATTTYQDPNMSQGLYNGYATPGTQSQSEQMDPNLRQYNQAALLQQYQMNGASLNSLPYIPASSAGAMHSLPTAYGATSYPPHTHHISS